MKRILIDSSNERIFTFNYAIDCDDVIFLYDNNDRQIGYINLYCLYDIILVYSSHLVEVYFCIYRKNYKYPSNIHLLHKFIKKEMF